MGFFVTHSSCLPVFLMGRRPARLLWSRLGLRLWLPSYRLSVFLIFLPRTTTFSSWLACLLLSPRFVFLLEDWHLLVSTGFCFSTPSKSLSVCSWSSCCSVLRAWISDTLRPPRQYLSIYCIHGLDPSLALNMACSVLTESLLRSLVSQLALCYNLAFLESLLSWSLSQTEVSFETALSSLAAFSITLFRYHVFLTVPYEYICPITFYYAFLSECSYLPLIAIPDYVCSRAQTNGKQKLGIGRRTLSQGWVPHISFPQHQQSNIYLPLFSLFCPFRTCNVNT